MENSAQSFHRLPVLNCTVNDTVTPRDLQCIIANNTHCMDIITNVSKSIPRVVEEFHPNTKNIKVKNPKYQLRRKSSSHKDIKETLSICSNYVKRLVHPIDLAGISRKYKKHRTSGSKSNQIKILFSSKARKLRKKRNNIKQELIDDIYDIKANRYCNNVEDTHNIYFMNNKSRHNDISWGVPSKDRQNVRKNSAVNKAKCTQSCKLSPVANYCYDLPTHYKVVQFPDYDQTESELEAINMARTNKLENIHRQTKTMTCLQRDKQAAAPKPCFSNAQRGGGDDCTIGIQCTRPKKDHIKLKKHTKLNDDRSQYFNHLLYPLVIHENAFGLAKTILKYLVLGLALIIWSPCIVTLYFCWLATYPLRPRFKSPSADRNLRCRRKSQDKRDACTMGQTHDMIENSIQTCEKNAWSFLFKGIFWAYQSIAISFKSLLNLDKNKSQLQLYPCRNRARFYKKPRVISSDPLKKYTLYYSKNKGWLMKSVKIRSNKSTKNKCNLKEVRKLPCETHFIRRPDYKTPEDIRSRIPERSYRRHVRNHLVDTNTCSPNCSRNRHKHLCADTSGLPVHIKLLNPMFNNQFSSSKIRPNDRFYNKKCNSLYRRHIRSTSQSYKNRSRCKRISEEVQCVNQNSYLKFKKKICNFCKNTKCNIKSIINDAETEIFGDNIDCGEIYIHTLRKRPWYCVYKNCPSFYPVFLGIYKFYENMCHYFLLLISACIWCPLMAFCYFCYAILCRCF